MNRRSLPVAAALAATAALLLTACGSGDEEPNAKEEIAGVDEGAKKSASPTPSATESTRRPEIKLPADVTLTFTPEQAGDAVQDAVLKDNAEFIRALNAAITAGDPRHPALGFYTEGEAAVSAEGWVKSFKDAGWTVTGTVRYFDRQVTVKSKTSASIRYCADESKGFSKVVKTGEIKGTKASKNNYIVYGAQVAKTKEGTWELMKISSTRGAAMCQP
ncbi:hypothetical protein [Streptomyces sp. A5-4]|uniref:hypothetical protein n=1 Tax=Streptomyces sp. A5-4 TaxID=3384771 RepID=UPI003DA92AF3